MVASKRWLAVALALIALTASLEYMPRNVIFRAAIPSDAAFPLNEGPGGTSRLWEKLGSMGYQRTIVYSSSGFAGRLGNVTDIVFLLVAPATPTQDAAEAPKVLDIILQSGKRVHVILLDEAPADKVYEFYRYAWARICGGSAPLVSNRILNNTIATIVAVAGGKTWRLPTGYTGFISGPDGKAPYTTKAQPLLHESGSGVAYFAAAWPYPEQEAAGQWYLVGARCTSSRGSVTVLADSTVAVNLAATAAPGNLEFVTTLVKTVAPDPNQTIIVVDEAFYAGGGEGEVNLVLRLHPSVLALAFAHIYRTVENEAIKAFTERSIYWLLPAAVGLILLTATWTSTQSAAKESYVKEKRRRQKPRIRLPGYIGPWRKAEEECMRAARLSKIAPEWGPLAVREHISEHRRELDFICRLVGRAPLPLRLIPLWGWAARRARVHLDAIIRLSGLAPTIISEEGVEFGGGKETG